MELLGFSSKLRLNIFLKGTQDLLMILKLKLYFKFTKRKIVIFLLRRLLRRKFYSQNH
jgi:hypothetical protein